MNLQMTDRCGRWMTRQVGQGGRPVSDVVRDLGCDWHTVNAAVVRYGGALLADPERFGEVSFLGLDETAFLRQAPYYQTQFTTSIINVGNGQLPDVVPGRGGKEPTTWLKDHGDAWLQNIKAGAFNLSSPYRKVFNDTLAPATLVADPFHVIKVRQGQTRRVPSARAERATRTPRPKG